VFRRILERESIPVSWYELGKLYRSLEARGLLRGGHFVSGVGGEQFALPEGITSLRAVRKSEKRNELVAVSGADPLNLLGILAPGPRLPSIVANRLLFRDGLPIATFEGGEVHVLVENHGIDPGVLKTALTVHKLPAPLRPYY